MAAYAEFSVDHSDVFVVNGYEPDGTRVLKCLDCKLHNGDQIYEAETTEAMVYHLGVHRSRGHVVPDQTEESIKAAKWPDSA